MRERVTMSSTSLSDDYFIVQMSDKPGLYYCQSIDPYSRRDVELQSKEYGFVQGEGNFFDWIFDDQGKIVGVELHLITHTPPLLTPSDRFHSLDYITWDCGFPSIWFFEQKVGNMRCLEDWESLFFKSASDNDWIVFLGVKFLQMDEIEGLMTRCVSCVSPYGTKH